MPIRFRTPTLPRRAAGVLFLLSALALAAGCGGEGSTDFVTGKVTYKGQPVAGEVVFVGQDKREAASAIAEDGSYKIKTPPKGDVVVLVKGIPKPPTGTIMPKDAPKDASAQLKGVAPPAQYSQASAGLKFKVTGGEQKHDIDLK